MYLTQRQTSEILLRIRLLTLTLKETINLSNFAKAYPVKLDVPLSGILKADVTTKFDMKAVENSEYEKIDNRGSMSLSGFNYKADGMAKPMVINTAAIQFNPSRVTLDQFNAKTGATDIAVNGTLDNFYGFLFKDQVLKGNFNMNSNKLVVNDFMAEETTDTTLTKTQGGETKTTKTTSSSEVVKIPAFLDCTITAKANTVVYDNLNLKDVSGKMIIKDEAVTLQNLKSSIFGGTIGMNGTVSTKNATPTFKMDLALNNVDITQSFTQLDMLKSIAPIANVISGKLTSTIDLSGNLDSKEMTPDLKSISGNLIGQLLSTSVNEKSSKVLNSLADNVKFIDLKKLNLNDLKANLTFDNGKVNLKPISLKYQDIPITLSGQHGFDQTMSYNVSFDVPAKYLGTEVNKLLASTKTDASKISVPVNAVISGNFQNPKVSTDLTQSVKSLTNQLIQQQKDKYIDKGKEALGNILSGNKNPNNTSGTTTPADTTKAQQPKTKEETKQEVKDKVTGGIKDLLNRKKKE
jgi:hypothetical protein